MDRYRIDSHKLIYHVPRVNDWLNGKNVYPIYIEISPSGACNHRCSFCALDYMGYRKKFLETHRLKFIISEMAECGVKSIMFGGEGEPLLHREIGDIALHASKSGIDTAFTTNGVLLRPELSRKLLAPAEWIKVSINAGARDTYGKIHGTKAGDFDRVIRNLEAAADIKGRESLSCTLGMQIVLLPENAGEVKKLSEIARDIGMDYLVVKPYSQHSHSETRRYQDIRYEEYADLREELEVLNTDHFQTIFRLETMKTWDRKDRCYECCLALPFWSYLDSEGNIWGCSAFLGDERFVYGNIYENSFSEIWQSDKRMRSLRWVENELDIRECRLNCRMDKINTYLWELKHHPRHVNFI